MQLNPNKTQPILVETRQQLDKVLVSSIKVAGADVQLADRLKLLDVTVDRQMTLDKQVSEICRQCNFHIRAHSCLKSWRSSSAVKLLLSSRKMATKNAVRIPTLPLNGDGSFENRIEHTLRR